ncbi:Hypothetical protein CINCED_3A023493 [Cinara cedri]|uniref:Myosin light chain kinase, smooth muscle n=1 Tax=Cinara cedri TaxID=506608 RepID=A0A5E4ML34_9HEMI|nr:Hypothetical protein CINCED_3A023493 [Cinara cedri]
MFIAYCFSKPFVYELIIIYEYGLVTTESTPSISWYKEDEQLTESSRYRFSTEGDGTFILNIVPLEIEDQTEWKCVAINKYGQTVTSSFLRLIIPKNFKSPRFLEELRIAFSNEGSVNLECKVIGVPQPQLKWFKDGQELNPGDMHKIISGQSGTCCLGTYTCQAHNCMGTVSSSATLLTMEDKSTVKSCSSEEYLSVGNPLLRNESLSTIPEERTSQMEKSYTIEEPADISFSFDGKEVTVSLYETPDLTHDEALQIIEMYADELSEHISEDNVVDLPSLRIVKESSISGPVMMEALVIDVPVDFCRQQTLSDTEFDGVSLTEDITLANNEKTESFCENSLEYFSDHLSSSNSKKDIFFSASETTPKNASLVLKLPSEDDDHVSFQTPKLFMSNSDDQILTQLNLNEQHKHDTCNVVGLLVRAESNNTEEEVSETLAEIENELPMTHNYCTDEIISECDEDGLYSTVLNKIRSKGESSVALSSEEDEILKMISKPNVDEFLKYMKIILEGTTVRMHTHESFNFSNTPTELERSIQALHSLAWKFINETEKYNITELDKITTANVSSLMTAINASLLALEQTDDPFGVSDNVLNEIQSSICFDLETLNNKDMPATEILDHLSDQIKNFIVVVNRQVARVTEQRIIAVLRNTIGTTLVYIKQLQQNCSKIKCIHINSLTPLFSMVQPLETILNDIDLIEEVSVDESKPNLRFKQMLIPPISTIAFSLNDLNTAFKNEHAEDDSDLKDIFDRINVCTNQFMALASQGTESNNLAECFISLTKPINDLCCHLRRLGRSTENIVSSDYGSDDKLLLDFETLFDELMMDIDTLINNVNVVRDSENNMNPLSSLLEPLQDMKIGLFQVNQVLLSNQTGSNMSYEVMSCFEHLSQQLVQLNNCIVNQSIVEETNKEIPFESSIKMMQNILFDDAIDDLGVNGILFGSVMKPLLQLQNTIVSKMASVESDLSFSEHTDVTSGGGDTQSLSLSLSNNAQTILDKAEKDNLEPNIIECVSVDKDANISIASTSKLTQDPTLFGNHRKDDLVIKRGFECDIGETFKDEEPNIIMAEDDHENSGFDVLFDNTELETIDSFVEDGYLDNINHSQIEKSSDLIINKEYINSFNKVNDDNIIPEHVLESFENMAQQNLMLNSSDDLFNEIQETLKNIPKKTLDETKEIPVTDTNTLEKTDFQNDFSNINESDLKSNKRSKEESSDVNKISSLTTSDELIKQNRSDSSDENTVIYPHGNIISETKQDESFDQRGKNICDEHELKMEKNNQVSPITHNTNTAENIECRDSDKSESDATVIISNIEMPKPLEIISGKNDDKIKVKTTVQNELKSEIISTDQKENKSINATDKIGSSINSSELIVINNSAQKGPDFDENNDTIKSLSSFKNQNENQKFLVTDNTNSTETVESTYNLGNSILSQDSELLKYQHVEGVDDRNVNEVIEDVIVCCNYANVDIKPNETEIINNLNSDGYFIKDETENLNKLTSNAYENSIVNEEELSVIENDQQDTHSQAKIVVQTIDSLKDVEVNNENQTINEINGQSVLIEEYNREIKPNINFATSVADKNDNLTKENNLVTEKIKSLSPNKEISNEIKLIEELNSKDTNLIVKNEQVKGTKTAEDQVENIITNVTTDEYNYNDTKPKEEFNPNETLKDNEQKIVNTCSLISSTTINPLVTCENTVNLITEQNNSQSENTVSYIPEKIIDKLSELIDGNQFTDKESLDRLNIEQNDILHDSNNIGFKNNENQDANKLNDQNKNQLNTNGNYESGNTKITMPTKITDEESSISSESIIKECIIVDSRYINECHDDIKSIDSEVLTPTVDLNVLDTNKYMDNKDFNEKMSTINTNCDTVSAEENKNEVEQIPLNENNSLDKSDDIEKRILIETENNKIKNQAIQSNEEIDSISSVEINKKEVCTDDLKKSSGELKQATILDLNDEIDKDTIRELIPTVQDKNIEVVNVPLSLTEENNVLFNIEVTLAETTELVTPCSFEENQVEVKYENENREKVTYEEITILDNKDNKKNNLELINTKEPESSEVKCIDSYVEQSSNEIVDIKKDDSTFNNDSAEVQIEQNTDKAISVDSSEPLDKKNNIEEKTQEEWKHVSESQQIIILENMTGKQEQIENAKVTKVSDELVQDELLTSKSSDISNMIHDEDEVVKSNRVLDDNIKINSEKYNDVENIINNCENLESTNFEEKIIMDNSEQSNESGIKMSSIKDDSDKILKDSETTRTNREIIIDNTLSSEIKYLPQENDQTIVKDFDNVENKSSESTCSVLIEECTALNNIEVITADCTQAMEQPNIHFENVKENYTELHEKLAECQTVVTLEKIDNLENINLDEKTVTIDKEKLDLNEPIVELCEISLPNNIVNESITQQNQILIEECEPIVNEKVVFIDQYTQSLEPNNLNDTFTESLVENKEITDTNDPKSSVDNPENKDESKGKVEKKNTEQNIKESCEFTDVEIIETKPDTSLDKTLSSKVNIDDNKIDLENKNTQKLTNAEIFAVKEELLPNSNGVDDTITKNEIPNLLAKENVKSDDDATTIVQQTVISKTELENDLNKCQEKCVNIFSGVNEEIKQTREEDLNVDINQEKEKENKQIKTEILTNLMKTEEHELETVNEVKVPKQIQILTPEKNASLQNDVVPEGEVNDLSDKEPFSTFAVKPKLHCVEKMIANQTECIMLENANILKSQHDETRNITDHARVEHELNIAAIGNMVIDYDSVKDVTLNEYIQQNPIANAVVAITVDEHSNGIVSKYINILKAPKIDLTTEIENITTNNTLEESIETSSILSENKNNKNDTHNHLEEIIENANKLDEKIIQTDTLTENESIGKLSDKLNDKTINRDNLILEKKPDDENIVGESQKPLNKVINETVLPLVTEMIDFSNENAQSVNNNSMIEIDQDKNVDLCDNTKITEEVKLKDANESIDIRKKSIKSATLETSTNTKVSGQSIDELEKEKSEISATTKNIENTETFKTEPEILNENNRITSSENENDKCLVVEIEKNITNGSVENNKSKADELENSEKKRGSTKKKTNKPECKKSPSPDKSTKSSNSVENINQKSEVKEKLNDDTVRDETVPYEKDDDKQNVNQTILDIKTKNAESLTPENETKVSEENEAENKKIKADEPEKSKEKRGSAKKKRNQPECKKSPSPDKSTKAGDVENINQQSEVKEKSLDDAAIDETVPHEKKDDVEQNVNQMTSDIKTKYAESITPEVKTKASEKNKVENKKSKADELENSKKKRGSIKNKTNQPECKKSPSPDKSTKSSNSVESINQQSEVKEKLNDDTVRDETVPYEKDDDEQNLKQTTSDIKTENAESITPEIKTNASEKNEVENKKSKADEPEKSKEKRGSAKKKRNQPECKKSPSPDKSTKVGDAENINQQSEVKEKSIDDAAIDEAVPHEKKDNDEQNVNQMTSDIKTKNANIKTSEKNDVEICEVNEKSKNESQVFEKDNENVVEKTERRSVKQKTSSKLRNEQSPSPQKSLPVENDDHKMKNNADEGINEQVTSSSREENENVMEREKRKSKKNNNNNKRRNSKSPKEPSSDRVQSQPAEESAQTIENKESLHTADKNNCSDDTDIADRTPGLYEDESQTVVDNVKPTVETLVVLNVHEFGGEKSIVKNRVTDTRSNENVNEISENGDKRAEYADTVEREKCNWTVGNGLSDDATADNGRNTRADDGPPETYRNVAADDRGCEPGDRNTSLSTRPDEQSRRSYDIEKSSSKRFLDVTAHRSSYLRPSTYRSLTPELWSSDPVCKYSNDRDTGRHYSSSSGSRSVSPYTVDSTRLSVDRFAAGNRFSAAYRCPSETTIRYCRPEDEVRSSYSRYGSRRRRGSDSFLHDSAARDGAYYSSWRLSERSRAPSVSYTEDLNRTKETIRKLYFCVRLIDQTVSSGTRVKFWCSIIGYPEPRVQWYREGQKLNSFTYNASSRYQTMFTNGLAQLIVDNAQSCDSGEYSCVAVNSSDRISTTGFLTVYTSPASVFRATAPKVSSSPSLALSLSTDCGFKRPARSDRLYLWNGDDFRTYSKFTSYGDWSTATENPANRYPKYPKFVTSIIADDVATYGGTIALQVRVQGSPLPNVTWMLESRPLSRSSGKYVYLDEGGLHTLLIKDSTVRDGGTYVCRACNLYGSADVRKAVSVVSPQDYADRRGAKPAIIVSRPDDRLNVAVGEDITVTLRVAGEPKPKVVWMRGSRDVTFQDRSLKETVNDYVRLSIKKAQLSDAGTYFIVAKNVYGSDRAFVTVGVRKRARSLTPPQIRSPTIGSRRPTTGRGRRAIDAGNNNTGVPGPALSEPKVSDRANNRISLTWDRPEKPETVIAYVVEAQSAEEQRWKQVGMTPTNYIDVYNLKPGYRYKFRVTARNRFGWGQPVVTADCVQVSEPKRLPEFHQPLPGETKVLLRHSATLQCHVRGDPKPRVTWFKDGEPLTEGRYEIGYTEMGRCTLTITDAVDADSGRYSCEAVNDHGRVCTLTVVEVMVNRKIVEAERRLQGCLMKNNDFVESAPIFTKSLVDRRVEVNSTVRLSCQVVGMPVPIVLWHKDGQPVDSTGHRQRSSQDSDRFCTLELTDVRHDDSGAYTAVALNSIGTATSRCVLEVINKTRTDPAIPEFVFGLPAVLEAADSIVLNAQIDAYRPVRVQWFKDGLCLRNGRRVDVITDHDGNLELRIARVTKRDSGAYAVNVSNDTGTVESRCDVTVVETRHQRDTGSEQISSTNQLYSEKPKFVVKPKFQEVEEGREVIIDSEIVGDPSPKITWLRDGLKPEYYRDSAEFLCVSDGNVHRLKIAHAKLTHTGTYTLLAENPHGQIKALISLQVYSTGHCKKKMENGIEHATVEKLPRISRGLTDIVCSENDSVTLECQLNITRETDVRWKKDGKLVRLGKDVKSELVDGNTARLEIAAVSPLHAGLYTCTAFNELGQDSSSARLILTNSQDTENTAPPTNGQRKTMLSSPILAGESTADRGSKRLKRSSAPKFYAVLHDRMADVGETVRFQCSVSGHPPPWSSWEKDGRPIGVNGRMRVREDDDHRSLEICDVTADDAGVYRITVENKFGKIQAAARLDVSARHQANDVRIGAPADGRRQSASAARAGENFTLSCDIRGNSMSDVTWYKNDGQIEPDDRTTSSRDELTARLSISNLQPADTGVYTCVARCDSGVTRCSAELCVFDTKPAKDSYLQPPIFVEGLVPELAAAEGERVELAVRLQGAVPMTAKWFKNDVHVPDCEDFAYVVRDSGVFGLSIADPFSVDSGTYSCRVTNTFGEAVSNGHLTVYETAIDEINADVTVEFNNNLKIVDEKKPSGNESTQPTNPATILWGPCDTTVLRGARVVLETSYAGNPEPRIQWLRAGKPLESGDRLSISNADGVSSLTIDSITADDCGKYVVRIDNGIGSDYHFASVAVEGPPDPPAGRPVVSVSETSADVTWSSPAYDGGCMVTGYSVEVRPFNQSDWKLVADKCHSLSHIVRGLAPGESYVFRVRAENMHGPSEASAESTPVYILQTDYGNTLVPKKVTIETGDIFNEQYDTLDELGKGRYGVVRKVKERESGKYYAAKFVRCIKSKDKDKAQEEVDIMNCLRHPKLLQLDAAFDFPREVVLVTEYILGGELFERVVADDFTLTEKDCILFTRQICEGVDYMHKQNVVHLDLKPENIMCQSRTSHQIKLIDFGLAQKIQPGKPVRVLFGTPEFIPPEIISYEPIGLESDMWSVGVICYVLLSGLSPFMGDNDSETFTNITRAEFDFDDDAFDAISQDSKDFISALLIKRKEKRLTARECLKHKWLAQQDMDMSCVILSTDKLKKFIIRRKWQKTGNAIRALGRMATLSAASKLVGGCGGGGGAGGGAFKMAGLSEEDSAGESPSSSPSPPRVAAQSAAESTAAAARSAAAASAGTWRRDSGISDCSLATLSSSASAAPHCRPHDYDCGPVKPSVIAEETSPAPTASAGPGSGPAPAPPPAAAGPGRRPPSSAARDHRAPAQVPLSHAGTGRLFEANRLIFDGGHRNDDGQARRKEPIRIQTADNFKKAVAFWNSDA